MFENSTEETIHEVSNINYNDTKLAELKSWKQNNVYHEVPYEGQDLTKMKLAKNKKKRIFKQRELECNTLSNTFDI